MSIESEVITSEYLRAVSIEEQHCAHSVPIRPRSRLAKVGPQQHAPSVTVHSLDEYTREASTRAVSLRRLCRIVYRGQTREYALSDGTISLLTGRERQSTNMVQRFPSWYNDWDLNQDFLEEFDKNLQVIARRERKPYPFNRRRPHLFFELLVLQGLLQHYGQSTACVDATTDPLVALWFALIERRRVPAAGPGITAVTYDYSTEAYGVVYLLEVPKAHVGRGRSVVPNVLSADLHLEVPNPNWRPRRQYAVALAQQEWGVVPGDTWNRLACCIKKRIVVRTTVADELRALAEQRFQMRWLFPPCKEDPIHSLVVSRGGLLKNREVPELLIFPEYLWHFKWCSEHRSRVECVLNQP